MNMKKWLAAAVACSGLMLAACGGQGNATADAGKDASAAAIQPYILVLQCSNLC